MEELEKINERLINKIKLQKNLLKELRNVMDDLDEVLGNNSNSLTRQDILRIRARFPSFDTLGSHDTHSSEL